MNRSQRNIAPGRGAKKGFGRKLKQKQHDVLMSHQPQSDLATQQHDRASKWLLSTLRKLGHPQPEAHNLQTIHTSDGDEEFQKLVEWLEDRCIRLWDLERRDNILRKRTNSKSYFTMQLPIYLEALDCPPSYYTLPQWYTVPQQRYRVLHWIASCALQEVARDQRIATSQTNSGMPPVDSINAKAFPLGFTTGDTEVDGVLRILRMQLVASMNEQQRQINQAVMESVQPDTAAPLEPKVKASFQRRRNRGT